MMEHSYPARIEIELASTCNLNCVYCPRRYLDKLNGFLPMSIFKKIIDESSGYPQTIIVLHRRGESLLNPEFDIMLQYIRGKFKEIQIATNATILTEEKSYLLIESVHFVSFSIDCPRLFNSIRINGDYERVESNILRFLEMNKNRVRTQVSMVHTDKHRLEDITEFKRIWDGKVDRIRIYEQHSSNGKFGSLQRLRGQRKKCVMPFYELLVYCDGHIGRCNHDWENSLKINIQDKSIKEIWSGEFYEDLRKQHTELRIHDSVCSNCDSWYSEIANQGTGEVIEK